MKILYFVNYIRTLPVVAICMALNLNKIIEEDLSRNIWYIGIQDVNLSSFNKSLLRNKCFRNIVCYRICSANKMASLFFRVLYPIKQDLEIYGEIGGGCTIYHGHASVINVYKAGKNLSVYQGVTLGNKGTGSRSVTNPTIGDNVSICANATVIGGVKIGNNVIIGAGSVVTKDIPDNYIAYGNPMILKKRQ